MRGEIHANGLWHAYADLSNHVYDKTHDDYMDLLERTPAQVAIILEEE